MSARTCDFNGCSAPALDRIEVDAKGGGVYFQFACADHAAELAAQLEAMPAGRGIAWIWRDGGWETFTQFPEGVWP